MTTRTNLAPDPRLTQATMIVVDDWYQNIQLIRDTRPSTYQPGSTPTADNVGATIFTVPGNVEAVVSNPILNLGDGTRIAVTAGKFYSFGLWLSSNVDIPVMTVRTIYHDASGAQLNWVDHTITGVSPDWKRLVTTFQAPASAAFVDVIIEWGETFGDPPPYAGSDWFGVSGLKVEEIASLTAPEAPYFDGGMGTWYDAANSLQIVFSWTGAANNSPSVRTETTVVVEEPTGTRVNLIQDPRVKRLVMDVQNSAGQQYTGMRRETIAGVGYRAGDLPTPENIGYTRFTFTTEYVAWGGPSFVIDDDTAPGVRVEEGKAYTFGLWARSSVPVTVTCTLSYYTAAGMYVSDSLPLELGITTDAWQRMYVAPAVPAGVTYAQARITLSYSGRVEDTYPAGTWFETGGWKLERVASPASPELGYFDGDLGRWYDRQYNKVITNAWTGPVQFSASTRDTTDAATIPTTDTTGKIFTWVTVTPTVLRDYDRAESDLVPIHTQAIRADDAPVWNGYPKAPEAWVRVRPVLSAEGVTTSASRPRPQELSIGSEVRFTASQDTWDETTTKWAPFEGQRANYYLQAPSLAQAPALEDLSYLSGREMITRSAFRIAGGSKFLCQFNDGIDAFGAFTVSLVLMPNPQTGSYPLLDYYHPSGNPDPEQRTALWLGDRVDFFYGGTGGSVDQMVAFNKTAPLFVTLSVDSPTATLTVAYSNRHAFTNSKVCRVGRLDTWMRMQVGGTYTALASDQEADFYLFEMNFWGRALDTAEVTALNSNYAAIYGVGSDWR